MTYTRDQVEKVAKRIWREWLARAERWDYARARAWRKLSPNKRCYFRLWAKRALLMQP